MTFFSYKIGNVSIKLETFQYHTIIYEEREYDGDFTRFRGQQPLIKENRKTWSRVKRNYELYLFLPPIILVYLLFKYYPMYGVQIAFKDFSPSQGIWGSEWVGFQHFIDF